MDIRHSGNRLISVMHLLFKNTNQFRQAETEMEALLKDS